MPTCKELTNETLMMLVALLLFAAACVAAVPPRPPMGFNPCFVPHVGCYMLNLGEVGLREMALAVATNFTITRILSLWQNAIPISAIFPRYQTNPPRADGPEVAALYTI